MVAVGFLINNFFLEFWNVFHLFQEFIEMRWWLCNIYCLPDSHKFYAKKTWKKSISIPNLIEVWSFTKIPKYNTIFNYLLQTSFTYYCFQLLGNVQSLQQTIEARLPLFLFCLLWLFGEQKNISNEFQENIKKISRTNERNAKILKNIKKYWKYSEQKKICILFLFFLQYLRYSVSIIFSFFGNIVNKYSWKIVIWCQQKM